jgi:hypothetical protein
VADLNNRTHHERQRAEGAWIVGSIAGALALRMREGDTPREAARFVEAQVRLLHGGAEMDADVLRLFRDVELVPASDAPHLIERFEQRAADETVALGKIIGWPEDGEQNDG